MPSIVSAVRLLRAGLVSLIVATLVFSAAGGVAPSELEGARGEPRQHAGEDDSYDEAHC